MSDQKKNKGGRPTKLTPKLLEVMGAIIDKNVLYLTDEDLLFLINEELPKDQQITDRTFQNYKAKNKKEELEEGTLAYEFFRLIKKALLQEKLNLLKKLRDGKSGEWQKYAWILERKFDEYNLKQKVESKVDAKVENTERPFKDLPTDKLEKIEDILKEENINQN